MSRFFRRRVEEPVEDAFGLEVTPSTHVARTITTSGKGEVAPLLVDVNGTIVLLTISTPGPSVKIGYGGNPSYLLSANTPFYIRNLNPSKAAFCYSDGGTGTTISVLG